MSVVGTNGVDPRCPGLRVLKDVIFFILFFVLLRVFFILAVTDHLREPKSKHYIKDRRCHVEWSRV